MVSLPNKSDFCYGELGNKWSSVGSEIGDIKCFITLISMVSCQKGPNRHAYAWQIGPFWQDTLDI